MKKNEYSTQDPGEMPGSLFAVFHSVKKSSPDESDAKYPSGYYVVFRIFQKITTIRQLKRSSQLW
jgi:hypothetical protein